MSEVVCIYSPLDQIPFRLGVFILPATFSLYLLCHCLSPTPKHAVKDEKSDAAKPVHQVFIFTCPASLSTKFRIPVQWYP